MVHTQQYSPIRKGGRGDVGRRKDGQMEEMREKMEVEERRVRGGK